MFYAAQVMASGKMPQAIPLDKIASVARWMCGAGKPGLILYGGYGTGKTTMLEAVKYVMDCRCNATASRIYTPEKFLPVAEADGRNLFGLLIIDELGREPDVIKDYGNEKRPVPDMICWREKRAMPLLAATNLTEDELRAKYGEYVYDRLRSLCLTGNDTAYRQAGRGDAADNAEVLFGNAQAEMPSHSLQPVGESDRNA